VTREKTRYSNKYKRVYGSVVLWLCFCFFEEAKIKYITKSKCLS